MMRKKATRKIIVFFLLLAATVVCTMTACGIRRLMSDQEIHSTSGQAPSTSTEQDPVATRTVSHVLGQTEIPLHPQRIVVLDANSDSLLDGVLALGLKPIGLARCSSCIKSDPFSDVVGDLPSVGTGEQPSLEKILMLKPDLILGYEWQESFYPKLSEIAPTVMVNPFAGGHDFKRNFRQLAEILGKSDQVDSALADYNEQVQEFQQRFGEKLKSKTVSVIWFFESSFHVYGPEHLAMGSVMSEAGIQFIPIYKELGRDSLVNMSLESLPDWDADFLFVALHFENDPEGLKAVFEQPLWSTLKAVRNDQVYIMTESPSGGPIGASQFIDDLSEYFSSKL
ncbi:MAG: iron-siderophore ABC transporter substrate-binding protein [Cyanobacteria bacterium P01_C01_bin.118]